LESIAKDELYFIRLWFAKIGRVIRWKAVQHYRNIGKDS